MDDEQYMIQGMHVHRHWGLARLSCVSNVNHRAPRPPPLLAPRVTDCPWLNATYAESTAACRTNDALSSSHLVVHCLSSVVAVVVVRAFWTSCVLPPLRSMDPPRGPARGSTAGLLRRRRPGSRILCCGRQDDGSYPEERPSEPPSHDIFGWLPARRRWRANPSASPCKEEGLRLGGRAVA